MDKDRSIFNELRREAALHLAPSGFRVVLRGDSGYDEARQISNSRFDLKPRAIAFPRCAEHVAQCIHFCQDHKVELRIRSGGHQHEGMCSANDVLMVRLSEMNLIQFTDDTMETAWIQVGARLEDVYRELASYGKIIPGGGCKGVNVGGLTLGGGWGLSARKYGLASDQVLEIEVVLADRKHPIVHATASNDFKDLFWALLGGGGGNFGIVTRFRFRLCSLGAGGQLSKYKMYWEPSKRQEVIRRWLAYQRSRQSEDTTSYLVLFADFKEYCWYPPPVYAGGMSYSAEPVLRKEVESWTRDFAPTLGPEYGHWPKKRPAPAIDEAEAALPNGAALQSGTAGSWEGLDFVDDFPGWTQTEHSAGPSTLGSAPVTDEAGSATDASSKTASCKVPFPIENCLAPHPHKVTSAFPADYEGNEEAFEKKLAHVVSAFIESHPVDLNVKSYISFYSMGGAIAKRAPDESAFWYRRKPFVIQIESWWNYPDPDAKDCRHRQDWQQLYADWVQDFRQALHDEGLIEGAFINFFDKKIPLQDYYGGNFERLKASKTLWDPTDFFKFEHSIPGAGPPNSE